MSKVLKKVQGFVPSGAPYDPKMYATLNLPTISFPRHKGLKEPKKITQSILAVQGTVPGGAPYAPKMSTTGITNANKKSRAAEIETQIEIKKQLTDDITKSRIGESMVVERKAKNYAPVIESLNQLGLFNFVSQKDLPAGISGAIAAKVQEWTAATPAAERAKKLPELMKTLTDFVLESARNGGIPADMMDRVLAAIRVHPGLAGPAAPVAAVPGVLPKVPVPPAPPAPAPVVPPPALAVPIPAPALGDPGLPDPALGDPWLSETWAADRLAGADLDNARNALGIDALESDDNAKIIIRDWIVATRDDAYNKTLAIIAAMPATTRTKVDTITIRELGNAIYFKNTKTRGTRKFMICNSVAEVGRGPIGQSDIVTLKIDGSAALRVDGALLGILLTPNNAIDEILISVLASASRESHRDNLLAAFNSVNFVPEGSRAKDFYSYSTWSENASTNPEGTTIQERLVAMADSSVLGLGEFPKASGKKISPNKIAKRLDKMLAAGQITKKEYARVMKTLN